MGDQGSLVAPRGPSPSIGVETTREPDPLKGGDVYKWAMDQVALIHAGRYNEVDWINVADEIESVGKSEVRSLTSHTEIVLAHMLKWDHQRSRRRRSWMSSIDEHRARIDKDLSDSASLKPKLGEVVTTLTGSRATARHERQGCSAARSQPNARTTGTPS